MGVTNTVDIKLDNVAILRSMASQARILFDRDQNVDTLKNVVQDVVSPQMNNAITDALTQIKSRYLVDARSGDEFTTVVHYTRIDVVVDMFLACAEREPSYLRLYDTFHSNDPGEGSYLTYINGLMDGLGNSPTCAYVTSFIRPESESQDDIRNVSDNLVFWRTYGDDGAGCSLTVRVPVNSLFEVLYGPEEAKSVGRQILAIKEALDPVLDIPDDTREVRSIKATLVRSLASGLEESDPPVSYLHKSEAYEYEREVRAIGTIPSIGRDQIRFERATNPGDARLRHYYERNDLRVTNLLTSGSVITVGPCVQNRENVMFVLKELMARACIGGVRILQSQVSYRNS